MLARLAGPARPSKDIDLYFTERSADTDDARLTGRLNGSGRGRFVVPDDLVDWAFE